MAMMKLAIACLAVILVVAEAFPENKGQGGSRGGFSGRRGEGGFGGGSNQQGGFGGPGGFPGGPGGFGGPKYPPHVSNATIEEVNALWVDYQQNTTGQNCTDILEKQGAILKASFDQYVVAQAANLTAPAQTIFNLYKQANDAFAAASVDVKAELGKFMMEVLMPAGGPGPKGNGLGPRGWGKF
uniref:Uncharacterized protein n=1 Tax=Plectus sambesii TaxID=2011161 RepID=A0A914WYN8_9BILA